MASIVGWELFAMMDGERLVGVCAKNPDRPQVIDVTDDLAHLLRHRATASPRAPSLSDPCPDPCELGWTMRQCFAAKKCSCARGVAMGYGTTAISLKD